MREPPVFISAAVEGLIDDAAVRRLIVHAGGMLGPVYLKNGKQPIRDRIEGFNNAARFAPWVVLVDLMTTQSARQRCGGSG